MNDHSKDSQTRYLKETAIALAREGFQTDRTHTDGLHVQLDGSTPKTRCMRSSRPYHHNRFLVGNSLQSNTFYRRVKELGL